jgi:hypothetical protein
MDFFINEQQLKLILQEQDRSRMSQYMKELYSYTYKVAEQVMSAYGLNMRMLLTWGASVGGLMKPLDIWLKSGEFRLNENERALIIAGVAMILFFESKSVTSRMKKKIEEVGLSDAFQSALRKGSEFKEVFVDFMLSLNTTFGAFMDIMAYCFIIPVLTDIMSFANRTTDLKETAIMIAERLLASGAVVVTSKSLVALVKRLLKRFK